MLRTMLIGLDGSEASTAAVKLGIDWAGRTKALLVGIGILDEPTIARAAPVMLGGEPYSDPVLYRERMHDARRQVEQFLEKFSLDCASAGVAFKVLEEVGLPSQEILREAQRYDAILLGTTTRFHFEVQASTDDTLCRVIRDSAGPVVTVPAFARHGSTTVVAFDGSLQAARSLRAYVATGLGESSPVHVLSVGPDKVEAARTAERAIDYLRHHMLVAEAHTLATGQPPAQAILQFADKLDAGLIVMGAYGQPVLREFFIGSVTATLLKESQFSLFLSH
jgi:nucleotide-binding universal stress UspA family protein